MGDSNDKRKKVIYDIKPMSGQTKGGSQRKPKKKRQKRSEPVAPKKEVPSEEAVAVHHARWPIWLIAIGAIILLFFTLSVFFSGASVSVEPIHEDISLDSLALSAQKNTPEQNLGFELVVLSETRSIPVESQETEEVSSQAQGTVRLYNDHSQQEQRLLIETRLETTDGLIFKTDEPIVIPGQYEEDGELIPGSVDVGVTADEAGEEYNIEETDFSIVGFAGTPKYENFYARSTSLMEGGFEGERYVLSDEEQAEAENTLTSELERDLYDQVRVEIPESYVTFPSATVYEHQEETSADTASTPELTYTSTLYAFLFEKTDLARAIAQEMISQYDSENTVSFASYEDLDFSLQYRDLIEPEEVDVLRFTLDGDGTITWHVDQEELKETLAGTHARSFDDILSDFETIQSAQMNIKPFWKRRFPDMANEITVTIEE